MWLLRSFGWHYTFMLPRNPVSRCPCLPFLLQALLRARGLRAAGRKEDVQLRLAEVLLEEHVEGNTPTDIDTPGVRELLISRAAEVQVGQGQGQTLLARGEDAQQGQGQGRGHGLLASGAAALKRQELEQRQGRQQPGDTAADRVRLGRQQELNVLQDYYQ